MEPFNALDRRISPQAAMVVLKTRDRNCIIEKPFAKMPSDGNNLVDIQAAFNSGNLTSVQLLKCYYERIYQVQLYLK